MTNPAGFPTTGPVEGAHATLEELDGFLGTLPDNAAQLLVRASDDVNRALLTAIYDPTDAAVIAALRKATLEQVAGMLASGDKTGAGTTSGPQSFTLGRLAVQGAAPTPAARTGVLFDRAWAVLQAAGLTGHAVQVW